MFRFTLREFLLLSVIVAFGIALVMRERERKSYADTVSMWEQRAEALALNCRIHGVAVTFIGEGVKTYWMREDGTPANSP